MNLTIEEYNDKLKNFLVKEGPNPAGDQFGRMAWTNMKTLEFRQVLLKQGYVLDNLPVVSASFQIKPGVGFSFGE